MNSSSSCPSMNSSSSSSSWYNSQEAERLGIQSSSGRSLGARGGMEQSSSGHSSSSSRKLSLEEEEMGPTRDYYDSFRRGQVVVRGQRNAAAMRVQVDTAVVKDIGQLPTDKDLTKSRVYKQRQLLQKHQGYWQRAERSLHKQTLRGRLRRMRSNKDKKKQASLLIASSCNEQHDNDDNESHDDDDQNSRGDEETGRGDGDNEEAFTSTSTANDDDDASDSKQQQHREKKNSSKNEIQKKGWFISSFFSIRPLYKPVNDDDAHMDNVLPPLCDNEKPPHLPADPSCCRRYLSERNPCYDWYMIQDKLLGKRFDLQKSFCPTSRCVQVVKSASSSLVVCAFLFSIMQFDGPFVSGYLKYYEHIGLFLSTLYMMLSMINSLLGVRQPWLNNVTAVQGRVRWSWMLFIVASHMECIMTVVYWSLLYEPGVTRISFLIVMKYGGVACQVLMDGLYINRIPLRWMFFWGLLWLLDILYVLYSVLYTFYLTRGGDESSVVIPVPGQQVMQSAPSAQEALPLYPFLDWKGDWQYALIFSVIFVCALSPAVHLFLWLSSLYRWPFCLCCCQEYRRYFVARKKDDKKKLKTREERRLERAELALRKQREREEAANAVAADMVHHDNLQKHFSKNRCNNNIHGDNQSACDTTANESSTYWNDSCSTVASNGGAGAGSCNDNGSYQVNSDDGGGGEGAAAAASASLLGDSYSSSGQEEKDEEEYDSFAPSSLSSSSPPLWQSHFTMDDIDEEGEEESTTTTQRVEDLFVDDDDEAVRYSKPYGAGRRPAGRF